MFHGSKDYLQSLLDTLPGLPGDTECFEGDGFGELIASADFIDANGRSGKLHFGSEVQLTSEHSDIGGDGFGADLATELTFDCGGEQKTVVVQYTAEMKHRQAGRIKQAIAASVVAAGLLVGTGHTAEAASFTQDVSVVSPDAFTGPYVSANWTLAQTNANGLVTNNGATVVLTGGNNNTNVAGTTLYTIAAAASGTVSFSWSYSSNDSAGYDFSGYVVNNVFTSLSSGLTPTSGTVSFNVTAGQVFGFRVTTLDNTFGAGVLTVTNFTAPTAVPEPTTTAGLLMFGAFGAWKLNNKRKLRT
ncbi:MAG: PEP-CTERM sorting domain-containing protein [Anaerolineae bacterium]|nr:PEP-CTERM sorting domain-containing protein [Gloeobacterales cyanobacterium ES-bin-313]